jgi:hypothetical protein
MMRRSSTDATRKGAHGDPEGLRQCAGHRPRYAIHQSVGSGALGRLDSSLSVAKPPENRRERTLVPKDGRHVVDVAGWNVIDRRGERELPATLRVDIARQ